MLKGSPLSNLPVNYVIILRIQNGKFSGYYFYLKPDI